MIQSLKKILCIEDDLFLLTLVSGKFTDAGIAAIVAHTGEEGVHLASTQNPDLILLDLMLPDKSGIEILNQLKSNEKTKTIPVIIFSNLGTLTDVEAGLARGAHSYLIKSNTLPGELVDAITKQLGILPTPEATANL